MPRTNHKHTDAIIDEYRAILDEAILHQRTYSWTPEQDTILREYGPKVALYRIAKTLKRGEHAVARRMDELGVKRLYVRKGYKDPYKGASE
jgi:hypothetical protein